MFFVWAAFGEAEVSPGYTQAGASGKDWLTSVTFAILSFYSGQMTECFMSEQGREQVGKGTDIGCIWCAQVPF